jgi:polysaccharide biosynthesis protein PelB
MSLNEPNRALPYFRRQARDRPDYLWWLAYADVLAENGLPDAAWSLRRRAWTELRRGGATKLATQPEIRDRVVALAMQFAPGDPAKAMLQSLISDRDLGTGARRRMRAQIEPSALRLPKTSGLAPGESLEQLPLVSKIQDGRELLAVLRPLLNRGNLLSEAKLAETEADTEAAVDIQPGDAAAKELALSYFLSTENFDTARAWLLSRYADELSRPAWAELSLALSHKDQGKLSRLLDELPDWLPKIEAVTAMQQTQRLAAAQSLAFETLESRPFSHEAHQKLIDTLLPDAPNVKARYASGYQGGLDFSSWSLDGSWRMPLSITMTAIAESTSLRTTDANLLAYVPNNDRTFGLNARGQRDHGWWQTSLTRRFAVADFNNFRLDWQQSFDVRLQTLSSVGLRQPALETPALRVGGMKDFVETRANYQMGQREYLVGFIHLSRLLSQTGTALGSGRTLSVEAGHRLRTEYPDITVRAGYSNSSFSKYDAANADPIVLQVAPASATSAIDTFIPRASSEFSVNASYGESARSSYSKALRPYGEIGLRHNSLTGLGFSLRSGLSTSVIGTDRLSLFLNAVSATPGNSRGLREVGLSYQWLY